MARHPSKAQVQPTDGAAPFAHARKSPHSRAEPLGAIRSARLARMPITGRCRVPGRGGLSEGTWGSDLFQAQWSGPVQIPTLRTWRIRCFFRH